MQDYRTENELELIRNELSPIDIEIKQAIRLLNVNNVLTVNVTTYCPE